MFFVCCFVVDVFFTLDYEMINLFRKGNRCSFSRKLHKSLAFLVTEYRLLQISYFKRLKNKLLSETSKRKLLLLRQSVSYESFTVFNTLNSSKLSWSSMCMLMCKCVFVCACTSLMVTNLFIYTVKILILLQTLLAHVLF